MFLYEEFDARKKRNSEVFKSLTPKYVKNNLRHNLRPYQEEALGRYLKYREEVAENREHLLFNMATGSGKTLLMAALILEKYKQGERNFIFFVNSTNIISKTRENFINTFSSKNLFNEKILIDGQNVEINEVTSFSDAKKDAINILFTTIHKLHLDLNNIRENSVSYEDFKEMSLVLLADEAHHLNAGLSKKEKDENNSWTSTIENIQNNAKKSSLLEFTATIDLDDKEIKEKYEDKILYRYDLKSFREDRYSKDVVFYAVDSSLEERMLQAIIISQYKKLVAIHNNIFLKPLVMFKSENIKASTSQLEDFKHMVTNLSVEKLENTKKQAQNTKSILKRAFTYLENKKINLEDFVKTLQEDFREERLLIVNSKEKSESDKKLLNTMENRENEIRAIFAVDMLNEGWDVLNLYDIVRMYDKRDAKYNKKTNTYKAGATSNQEKQLIGRGARYYPFVINEEIENKYKRKFDENISSELRVLEELHYHAFNNPSYIQEMKQLLIQDGIYEDETSVVIRNIHLKDTFLNTRTYSEGKVWVNERIAKKEYLRVKQGSFDNYDFSLENVEVILGTDKITEINIFENTNPNDINVKEVEISYKLAKFGNNVIRHCINKNKFFTFEKIEEAILGVGSMDKFIQEIGRINVHLKSRYNRLDDLSQEEKVYVVDRVLQSIVDNRLDVEDKFIGTEKFISKPLKNLFLKEITRKYSVSNSVTKEAGESQKDRGNTRYYEDLDSLDWYAYSDNFGTSEEKSLVRELRRLMQELEKKWTDIYLLRNEKAVRIYSFEDGQAFEPDFILFANDKETGNISWQIFIEPKGGQFADDKNTFEHSKEGWKEKFLLEITKKSDAKTLLDNEKFRIVGLPLYNENLSKDIVLNNLKEL